MALRMNKKGIGLLGLLGLMLAATPLLWGTFKGVPQGTDRLTWVLACADALAAGIYMRKFKDDEKESILFFLVVMGGFAAVAYTYGTQFFWKGYVYLASVSTVVLAFWSTSLLLRWSKVNQEWLGYAKPESAATASGAPEGEGN